MQYSESGSDTKRVEHIGYCLSDRATDHGITGKMHRHTP
jgi:hypothetical protein